MAATKTRQTAAELGAAAEEKAIQREEEASRARVYQLALWADDKRAMPHDFVACALFAASQTKTAPYLRNQTIATANGYSIAFTGKRLTQVHADILMGIAYVARAQKQGHVARFQGRSFMRLIGRAYGSYSETSLRALLDDLIATAVRITDASGRISYSSSILTRAGDVSEGEENIFAVEITRDFCRLFERFTEVDWAQRRALLKKPLAGWLQIYFSQFQQPVAVAELHRLSGAEDELRFFRRRLRKELETLKTVGVLGNWAIDQDVVYVATGRRALPARLQPQLQEADPESRPEPTVGDPDQWVTAHDPMTPAQAKYLKALGAPEVQGMSKAEASKEIRRLRGAARPTIRA